MKFPLINPKYTLTGTIVAGLFILLCSVWLSIRIPGTSYAGAAILVFSLLTYFAYSAKLTPSEVRYVILVCAVGTGLIAIAEKNPILLGEFSSGKGLSPYLGSVGLLSGLLIAIPVFCSFPLTEKLSSSIYLRSLIGAALVTISAILIFYNAQNLGFFTWFEYYPSLSGFIVWFVISFFLHFAGIQLQVRMENPIALPLYCIWVGSQVVMLLLSYIVENY